MYGSNTTAPDEPNLARGVLAGALAALVSALIWAMVTAVTGFEIGYMAVGVGLLVGYAVRTLGQGEDVSFGIAGAFLALFGCLLGNLLAVCIIASRQEHLSLFHLVTSLSPSVIVELMKVTFNPVDLLFYAIALYEGFRFSIVH